MANDEKDAQISPLEREANHFLVISLSLLRAALPRLARVGLMALAVPALAHHSFSAEFDSNRPIDLTGIVTKVRWVNPHSWLYLDVSGPDGIVTSWGVEFGAPVQLAALGLAKKDIPAGSKIHIKGYMAKSGRPYGYSLILTLADGRTFRTAAPGVDLSVAKR